MSASSPDSVVEQVSTTFAAIFWDVWKKKGYRLPCYANAESRKYCYMFCLSTDRHMLILAHRDSKQEDERLVLHGVRNLETYEEEFCLEQFADMFGCETVEQVFFAPESRNPGSAPQSFFSLCPFFTCFFVFFCLYSFFFYSFFFFFNCSLKDVCFVFLFLFLFACFLNGDERNGGSGFAQLDQVIMAAQGLDPMERAGFVVVRTTNPSICRRIVEERDITPFFKNFPPPPVGVLFVVGVVANKQIVCKKIKKQKG